MKIYINNPNIAQITLNGQPLKFEKEKNGKYVCNTGVVGNFELRFVRVHEMLFSMWFLRALFFWIIGILGIFTPWYDSKGAVLDAYVRGVAGPTCEMKLSLLSPKIPRSFQQAVYIEASDITVHSQDNLAYIKEPTAIKRKRIYAAFSWIARIAVITVVVFMLFR